MRSKHNFSSRVVVVKFKVGSRFSIVSVGVAAADAQHAGRAGGAAVSACEDWTARLDRFDDAALDLDVMQDIERLGLGRRKGGYNPKQSSLRRRYTCSASLVGAMLTAQDQVPVRSSRSIAQQTRPRQLARWTKECTSLSQCVGAAVGDGAS